MKKEVLFLVLFSILLVNVSFAELDAERQHKLIYGKVLYIKEINVTPPQLFPGGEAEIKMEIENVGNFSLKDVIVKLELPSQFSPSVGDMTEKKTRLIEGNTQAEFSFKISSLPDSEIGIYKIPVIIKYINKIGDEIEENNTISLSIGARPEILVIVESSDLYRGKKTGIISIKIINKGLIDVKFMSVKLEETEDFSLISGNEEYLGDVDSDDFEVAEFKVRVNDEKENIAIPVKLEYRDANNNKYSEEKEIIFNLPEKADLKNEKSNSLWILVIIALIIIYFVYRYYKKRKK